VVVIGEMPRFFYLFLSFAADASMMPNDLVRRSSDDGCVADARTRTRTRTRTNDMPPRAPYTKPEVLGAACWQTMDKVNAELFALTHGALVRQILKDCEDDIDAANAKLDAMGYSMGTRMIEEYLSKTLTSSATPGAGKCGTFEEAAEAVAKIGLRMFLNVGARCVDWDEERTKCTIEMDGNPLAMFVELPEKYGNLGYCNALCGAIRGALEMVRFRVTCTMASDPLKTPHVPDALFAIRMELIEIVPEEYPFDE